MKPVIKAAEAIELIRAGQGDEAIMERYNISAMGLESLFRKLVRSGFISQSEIDSRALNSQRSHMVTLASIPRPGVRVVKLDPDEAVREIRSGLTDAQLMEKFNLSAKGLDRLFRKLVLEGIMDSPELRRRKASFQWADIAFQEGSPEDNGLNGEDQDTEDFGRGFLGEGAAESPVSVKGTETKRLVLAAMVGAVVGMLLMVAGYFIQMKMEEASRRKMLAATASDLLLDEKVDQYISVLEAIFGSTGEPDRTGDKEHVKRCSETPECQQCLEDCGRRYTKSDSGDKDLLFNCRLQCLAQYDDRVRSIRERFYGASSWE